MRGAVRDRAARRRRSSLAGGAVRRRAALRPRRRLRRAGRRLRRPGWRWPRAACACSATLGARRVVEDEPLPSHRSCAPAALPLPGRRGRATRCSRRRRRCAPAAAATAVRIEARFARRGRRLLAGPRRRHARPARPRRRAGGAGGRPSEVLVLPRTEPVRAPAPGGDGAAARRRRGRPARRRRDRDRRPAPHRAGHARLAHPLARAGPRRGELIERRLRADADTRPLVVLDPRGAEREEDLDAAVRAAASLALHLARAGGCALLLPGERRAAASTPTWRGWPHAARPARARPGGGAPPRLARRWRPPRPGVYVAARRAAAAAARARRARRAAASSWCPAAGRAGARGVRGRRAAAATRLGAARAPRKAAADAPPTAVARPGRAGGAAPARSRRSVGGCARSRRWRCSRRCSWATLLCPSAAAGACSAVVVGARRRRALRRWRRRRRRLRAAPLVAAARGRRSLLLVARACRVRLLVPGAGASCSPGIGAGLDALPRVRVPYTGADDLVRDRDHRGGGALLAALAARWPFWPRGARAARAARPPRSRSPSLYAIPAVERDAAHPTCAARVFAVLLGGVPVGASALARRGAVAGGASRRALAARRPRSRAPRLDGAGRWSTTRSSPTPLRPRPRRVRLGPHATGRWTGRATAARCCGSRPQRAAYWKADNLDELRRRALGARRARRGRARRRRRASTRTRKWTRRSRRRSAACAPTSSSARAQRSSITRRAPGRRSGAPGTFVTGARPLRRGDTYSAQRLRAAPEPAPAARAPARTTRRRRSG